MLGVAAFVREPGIPRVTRPAGGMPTTLGELTGRYRSGWWPPPGGRPSRPCLQPDVVSAYYNSLVLGVRTFNRTPEIGRRHERCVGRVPFNCLLTVWREFHHLPVMP